MTASPPAGPPAGPTASPLDRASVPDPVEPTRGRSRLPIVLVVVAVVAALAIGLGVLVVAVGGGGSEGSSGGETLVFDVPPGTGARMAAGDEVALLPEHLELQVGDTIEIRNRDDQVHAVGPYTVAPQQTLRQTFESPGVVEGACSLHPSGQVEIVIR